VICKISSSVSAVTTAEYPRLLLALDPLREASYRLLMRALGTGGNPAQAAAIYAACCRGLRERTGMAPSNETERIFRRIAGRK
jgi:DNA-binding SARP family transcriptional activator